MGCSLLIQSFQGHSVLILGLTKGTRDEMTLRDVIKYSKEIRVQMLMHKMKCLVSGNPTFSIINTGKQ